jgi:large subunit ribosomal protein L4
MKADVTTMAARKAGSVELPDHIFGLEPRADILHRMVVYQLAKRRAGTHAVKNRADITATGKKFVRQKGSGGARHGSRKVPQFRGGGRAFGPHPRDHAIELPKKFRALALRHALSAKARASEVVVLDDAVAETPKTAELTKALKGLDLDNALIIGGEAIDENFARASRNIPDIDVLPVQGINVYDVLRRSKLVLTRAALARLEERFHG